MIRLVLFCLFALAPVAVLAKVSVDIDSEIERVATTINSWDIKNSCEWTPAYRETRIASLDKFLDQVKGYKSDLANDQLRAKYHALVAGLHGYKIAYRQSGLVNLLGLRNNILKAIDIENDNDFAIASPSRRMLERSIFVMSTIKQSVPKDLQATGATDAEEQSRREKARAEREEEFDGKIETLKDYLGRLK